MGPLEACLGYQWIRRSKKLGGQLCLRHRQEHNDSDHACKNCSSQNSGCLAAILVVGFTQAGVITLRGPETTGLS